MNDDEKEKKNDAENLSDSIDSDAKKESEENLKLKKKQNEQASSDESVSRVESIGKLCKRKKKRKWLI